MVPAGALARLACMDPTQRSMRWDAQAPAPVRVEVFVPPCAESARLLRRLPWLLAPPGAERAWYTRALGFLVVAPFTQFTALGFELQMFLFQVFHTRVWARLGHGLGMPAVNFFAMVLLSRWRLGPHPTTHAWPGPSLTGATAYAAVLLGWYLLVALRERLYLWWALTVACTAALALGADAFYCHTFTLDPAARTLFAPTIPAANPFLWMWASAQLIMLSHVPEPRLPPRVADAWRWMSVGEFLLGAEGARHGALTVARRALLLGAQFVSGTLSEWWASPRLMPYNLLALMFEAGYRPAALARSRDHADRALASGNPALDYVGIGGGAFLRAEEG